MKILPKVIQLTLACSLTLITPPIYADEVRSSITATSYQLGVDELGQSLGNITQGFSMNQVRCKTKVKAGEICTSSTTWLNNSITSFASLTCLLSDGTSGFLFLYNNIFTVSTVVDSGDQVHASLDPSQDSTICSDGTNYEIFSHSIISGGTGLAENACGWLEFTGRGRKLAHVGAEFISVAGEQIGEIFLDPADAPSGTPGCP